MSALSPAAQVVLGAWLSSEKGARMLGDPTCLAAALRAAVDQVLPAEKAPKMMHLLDLERLAARQHKRAQFLAIVAELDGGSSTRQED